MADEETKALGGTTTHEESTLVDAVKTSMNELIEIFTVPEDSAWSPDELCRLAYEPFPARVRVRVPGDVLELEGFREDGGKGFAVPDTSLFGAIESLEGRWVAPDPFVAYVRHGRSGAGKPFDVASFSKLARSYPGPTPTAGAVREAMVAHLTSATAYRIRWSTAHLKDADREIESWDDPLLTD